jgi:hypothetical protein
VAYILGWVILLFQPRWVILFAFAAAIIALSSPALFAATDRQTMIITALAVFLNGVIFVAVGGPIVAVRKWMHARGAKSSDTEIDAELASIRAQAAARESPGQGAPPPT